MKRYRVDYVTFPERAKLTEVYVAKSEEQALPAPPRSPVWIMDAVAFKRADFLGDEKWRGYLPYCNQFSFVCPKGMIELDELPEDVGLVYYDPEKESLYTRRKAVVGNEVS